MKHTEDFREAFGQADSGFVRTVSDTLQELAEQEEKKPVPHRRRVLIPAIAAALVLALGIGIASTGHWGVLDWLKNNRADNTEATALPPANEAEGPYAEPVNTEFGTLTVREVRNDGLGIYLSVLFTPKEEGTLAYNWGVDPFSDGPETMGVEPDYAGQTLAKWAVSHGYSRLVRVSLFSRAFTFPAGLQSIEEMEAYLTEQGIPYKKASDGNLILNRLTDGEDIDSYMNNTTVLEEDGSTLIMAAGGSISGRRELQLGWAAVPLRMDENGRPMAGGDELDMASWTQGWIPLAIPDQETGEQLILAEYTGTAVSMAEGGDQLPVTVQLIRTDLNDYYVIRTADTGRAFLGPILTLEGEEDGSIDEWFGSSAIYSFTVQEQDGELVFTIACRLPEDLPDRLVVVWFDTEWNSHPETTLVSREK